AGATGRTRGLRVPTPLTAIRNGAGLRASMKTRLLLALALLLVVALGVVVAVRHRHPRVDMVAKLADLAAREGVWDNPWDKTQEKIADLQRALATERDPRNRFTLEREIAAQAVYQGDVDL